MRKLQLRVAKLEKLIEQLAAGPEPESRSEWRKDLRPLTVSAEAEAAENAYQQWCTETGMDPGRFWPEEEAPYIERWKNVKKHKLIINIPGLRYRHPGNRMLELSVI